MSTEKIVNDTDKNADEYTVYRNPTLLDQPRPGDKDYMDLYLEADHWLGELLACLHGDGGHYQGDHGMEKATKDAISAHYEQQKALDELRAERDAYRAALERIASQWAQPARDIALATLKETKEKKL